MPRAKDNRGNAASVSSRVRASSSRFCRGMPYPVCEVVVVGASAGGVQALIGLVSALPLTLSAAVLVVVHVPAGMPSRLAQILDGAGLLPAARALDAETIQKGRIYVAPPDQHLSSSASQAQVRACARCSRR